MTAGPFCPYCQHYAVGYYDAGDDDWHWLCMCPGYPCDDMD